MPNPGTPIQLSPETSEALASQLGDLLTQAESDHAPYLSSIPTWWDWYDAKPLVARRSDPWPDASNIVVPLIQTFADATTARMWGAMHTAKRTWSYTTQNEDLTDLASTIGEFINAESRSTFDVLVPTHDWAFENAVVGSSVLGVFWRNRYAYRYTGGKTPTKVTIARGPEFVHIPRENILWERDRTIQESSFVARLCLYNWSDMMAMVDSYGWDEETVEECAAFAGIEGPAGNTLARKRERDGQNPGTGAYQEPHGVWEIWLDAPLASLLSKHSTGSLEHDFADPDEPQVPIVVDYHRAAGKILKVRAHPYYFWRWPFLDIYFQKLPGRGASKGLSKMLEHMQRSATTLVNQSIDRRTLENSIPFVTNSPALRNYRFNPMAPIFAGDVDNLREAIIPLNLVSQPVSDISLMNFITSVSERVTGISDVNLGRETRLGGHPAPATNTLVQLQEGAKIMGSRLKLVRQQLSTAAEWLLSMYQQYELSDTSRLVSKLGPKDAARLATLTPENLTFDAYALSESVNPDADRNAAITLTQVTTNYYGFVMRTLSLIGNPQVAAVPGVKEAGIKSIEAMTESYKRILQASDVDEIDKFILQLKESQGADAAAIGQFGQLAADRAAAGAGGQGAPGAGAVPLQQPGMGPTFDGAAATIPVVPGSNGSGY